MRTGKLGYTDLQLTRVGLGTWGPLAAGYGLGSSEEMVGRALAVRRDWELSPAVVQEFVRLL